MWSRIVWATVCALGLCVLPVESARADKPAGVGSNLHRSFMIKRAQRRAAQGRPVPKHVGIWVAGGYNSMVFGPDNPYLRDRGMRYVPRSGYGTGQTQYAPQYAAPVYETTLWDRYPHADEYTNPFAHIAPKDQQPAWIAPLQTERALTRPKMDNTRAADLQNRVAAVDTSFRAGQLNEMLDGLQALSRQFGDVPEVYQLAALERFQTQDYARAAALAHTSLTAGRCWNWQGLRQLYDSREPYVEQLRKLEETVSKYPDAPELRFLLGYHYLMLGHDAAAVDQFRHVAESLPEEKLPAAVLQKRNHAQD